MTTKFQSRIDSGSCPERPRQRPAWRQRLVDTERGITQGFRLDSTMFVHLFSSIIVLVAAGVLGMNLGQWSIIALGLTFVLSAEMFNQVLKTLLKSDGRALSETSQQALRIATAAVFVAILGAVVSISLIFAQRLDEMF
jgi:diacylglycerol kinase